MGVKEEKISYIPNGVDLKPIIAGLKRAPMSSKKSGNAPPVMGYIGQLIDRKNVDDIITAYVILQKRYPNLRLMIVGEGENRAALQAKVAKLDCASQVEFSGFVNDPLARLRQFDMFVMTSSLEGIPRCLMESMAMGVPVVAYNIPGVDQLIVHKETGLLAPLGEVQKLTKQCDALLRSAQLAETLRVNARKHVIGQFSAQRMAKQYLGLYQKLVVDR